MTTLGAAPARGAAGATPERFGWFVGGEWIEPDAETAASMSPATGIELARTPVGGAADATAAVAAAAAAAEGCGEMPASERSRLCERVADALEAHREELARWLTLDQGKPLAREAEIETQVCPLFFRHAAQDVLRLNGETLPSSSGSKVMFTHYASRGPYAVITPWNFPYNIPAEHLSAHLAAGNPVVWIPSPQVAACSLAFARAVAEADLPKGVFNVVTGPGEVVGDAAVTDARIVGVSLTGSFRTADIVMRRAGAKPALLELGGNGPIIVLADADLEAATRGIAFSAFFNAGQACSATERVLVARDVHDELLRLVVAAREEVVLGDPLEASTTMGPLNNEAVAAKMDAHLEDATSHGAIVVGGGKRAAGFPTRLFYEPTVVDGVNEKMIVNEEETFGPIVPLLTVSGPEEALSLANARTSGLVASVYTRDLAMAMRFARRLRTGLVNVNETPDYWELNVPYGGAAGTNSGYGRLGGLNALRSVMDLRSTIMEVGA